MNNNNYDFPNTKNMTPAEINKYLYEIGLQNVFNDYQKNIAGLSSKRLQDIQDAYYIREMSKKYLGEYASNAGINDVSGNLVDIYSNYQKNITDINANYDALKLNLEKEYQNYKTAALGNIMRENYNMELEKMDKNARDIAFKILKGETDGLSNIEFLETHKDRISEEAYQALYGSFYDQNLAEVYENLLAGYYGYDDQGKKIENAEEYLKYSQSKHKINANDAKKLADILKWESDNQLQVWSFSDPSPDNPYRNNKDFKASYYTNDEYIDSSSETLKIGNLSGEYAISKARVEDDENSPARVSEDLTDDFISKNNQDPVVGSIHQYKGSLYYFDKSGFWKRLVYINSDMFTMNRPADMISWKLEEKGVVFQNKEFVYQGITYTKSSEKAKDSDKPKLESLFKEAHGTNTKDAVVFYNGRFWTKDGNNYIALKKK